MTIILTSGQIFALGVATGIVVTIIAIFIIAVISQMKK